MPATVAILNGQVKVGLTKAMLQELAENSKTAVKVSRRDFPYVMSKVNFANKCFIFLNLKLKGVL